MELTETQIRIIIWFITIMIMYLLSVIMLLKTLKIRGEKTKKRYFSGATLFLITYSTCRLFLLFGEVIYKNLILLTYIGSFLGVLALTFIVEAIESAVYRKTKHIVTLIGFIGVGIDFFEIFAQTVYELNIWVQSLIVPILTVFIILIYFSHIFKSTGQVRNHFILMTIGVICIGVGEMGNTGIAKRLMWWAPYGAPLLMLIGFIILTISVIRYYKEPEPSSTIMGELK